jgi:hypothetical protein
MLTVLLTLSALAWGFWLMLMIRYPRQWAGAIDALHLRLARYGLASEWMKRFEKGLLLKTIVGLTTILILTCLAVTLRHPDALSNFLRSSHFAFNESRRIGYRSPQGL